ITSIISSWANTWDTVTGFSKCSLAHLILAPTEPPPETADKPTWISMMWAFFWRRRMSFIWVWASTRITLQYFFIF
ncbi:unnamed protein product, partial [Ixodes pacificus]